MPVLQMHATFIHVHASYVKIHVLFPLNLIIEKFTITEHLFDFSVSEGKVKFNPLKLT